MTRAAGTVRDAEQREPDVASAVVHAGRDVGLRGLQGRTVVRCPSNALLRDVGELRAQRLAGDELVDVLARCLAPHLDGDAAVLDGARWPADQRDGERPEAVERGWLGIIANAPQYLAAALEA
jgi:hypothetical protein